MIKLKKLYSQPVTFDPITFESGINIILGKRSEENNKTNGVGKSIAIEFLNFCLLKKASDSRITLIPETALAPDTIIYLDLDMGSDSITIARAINFPYTVTIYKNEKEIFFEKLEDASEFLGNLYFEKFSAHTTRISFRNLLAPIIRDERSEFKDIIQCFDTKKRIPNDYSPHLFFMNMSIDLYSEIKRIIEKLNKKTTYFTETTKLITNDYGKVKDAKAKANELESQVSRINASIERLKNNESFASIQNDLVKLESRLAELRTRQKAILYEIKQISSFPEPENISEREMAIIFNQFKNGLGDIVQKSLQEVKEFKSRIESFKKTIVNKKLKRLRNELLELNQEIEKLDNHYSERIALLDNGELLGEIKASISIFTKKNQELNDIRSLIDRLEKAEKEKKELKNIKDKKIFEYDNLISENKSLIKNFERTILHIHKEIMGNSSAYFQIETVTATKTKEFLYFDLRIDDDGSHSIDRSKVFIYDLALLINSDTKKRHPRFLVHDNIFNVDNDSLEKSLNFLHKYAEKHPEEFQYILTLNRDMVEIMEERKLLEFDIMSYTRASYTKENRVLKKKYREKQKRRLKSKSAS